MSNVPVAGRERVEFRELSRCSQFETIHNAERILDAPEQAANDESFLTVDSDSRTLKAPHAKTSGQGIEGAHHPAKCGGLDSEGEHATMRFAMGGAGGRRKVRP